MLRALLFSIFLSQAASQTFTSCNPLVGSCPADPALAKTINIDFTKGASDAFTVSGSPSYQSDGMHLTVAQRGDAPTLTSKWYMMFGHIDIKMKAAPGQGIVSSVVLQSDDLDEIDLEWVGSDATHVQSNYFGKGQTVTYDRGAYHPDSGITGWHTYSIDYTAEQIVWQVDGVTVRVLTPSSAETNQYPQTPMQLKIGIWSGGDPSNSQGTITWAGGPTNYAGGPYTMIVQSVKAVDYSTGTSYSYGDHSGTWQSIKSNGGSISGGSSGEGSSAAASAPSVTETTLPATSSVSSPPVSSSASQVSTSVSEPPTTITTTKSTPTTAPAQAGSGSITTVVYNNEGFATTIVVPSGWTKQYNSQGFLIIPSQTGQGAINAVSTPPGGDSSASVARSTAASTTASSSLTTSTTTSTSTISSISGIGMSSSTVVSTSLVTSTTTSTTSSGANSSGTTSSTNAAAALKICQPIFGLVSTALAFFLLF